MIPAGRIDQERFEELFREVAVHMPDGHGIAQEHYVTAIGHFFQYFDSERLDMDVDPSVETLMDEYGLGFATYVYNNALDVSQPPPMAGRLSERRLGQHQSRPVSPKIPDEVLDLGSEGGETEGGISRYEMGSDEDGEALAPLTFSVKVPPLRILVVAPTLLSTIF